MMCVKCFQHSDHEGHDVAFRTNTLFSLFAPVCHCGALDRYKDSSLHTCTDHPPADPNEPPPTTFDPGATDSPEVTEEFKRAIYDTFVICIEYIIETFQCAPPPEDHGKLPKDKTELKTTWGIKHTHQHDKAKRAEGPWSVAIFTDERHNEPELVRQMQHATGADYEDCQEWVRELDTLVSLVSAGGFMMANVQGRRVVLDAAESPTTAFFLANMFQQIDVPVSLRHAHDTYQESVASTLLEWLADICACHVAGDPDLTTQIMAQVLREEMVPAPNSHIAADLKHKMLDLAEPEPVSRLEWMFVIDSRLWNQPKMLVKQIYAKMMTVHPLNMQLIGKPTHHSPLLTN
jgi:E3 ubiquitin-protein ligase UBR1